MKMLSTASGKGKVALSKCHFIDKETQKQEDERYSQNRGGV